MAVQSQYPFNAGLPDYNSRTRAVVGNEDRSYLAAGLSQNTLLNKFQIQPPPAMGGSNQLRLFSQLAGAQHGHATQLPRPLMNDPEVEAASNLGSRKRAREAEDLRTQWQQHHQQLLTNVPDFQQNTGPGSVVNPHSTGVSTGLRLTFEDDRIRSSSPVFTSGRVEASKNLVTSAVDDYSSHLQQERDEIEQLLKIQGEQLKQLLEEKRQRHYHQLIAAVEEGFSRKLRDKDVDLERAKRQNQELLDRLTQLTAESHYWEGKLRNTEQVVHQLKSGLHQFQQQPCPLSREQSKEGCGDSEADDCASSHVDDRFDAHIRTFLENKELREQRTCRVCRCNDVSMLLLPCRHLCLCKECEGQLIACPLCRVPKNASVQVYMS